MLLRVPHLVVASAFLLLGCGGTDEGGVGGFGAGGAGGGGGSATTTTDTTSSTFTTSTQSGGSGGASGGAGGTSSGGAGGALPCDSLATCGNTGEGCVACAISGACAAVYEGCFTNDQCVAYQQCIAACVDDVCLAACEQASPDGKTPYDAFFQCVLCDECPTSCAPASCPP